MRIGAVSYLNTKPLVDQFPAVLPGCELSFDLPSRLADQLAAGQLDVALIPSVEYFQNPDYTIVSDACIGCEGEVWSVKLVSRVPMQQIRTLGLDEGSRTSAALSRVLLKERYNLSPQLVQFPIGQQAHEMNTDAVVVIGDRAMKPIPGEWLESWDLGQQWLQFAGLPFVFAMWVARPEVDASAIAPLLSQARDLGLANVNTIAAREAPRYQLSTEECLRYFTQHLRFYLGARQRQGLEQFRYFAHKLGLVKPATLVQP